MEEKYTSLDILRLITWASYYKGGVILNKTQVQKLLYMCYGVALAQGVVLFSDDSPKAWPFGPVFPKTYKHYIEDYPTPLTKTEKSRFSKICLVRDFINIVKKYCRHTSRSLSEWSHQKNGPWWRTVYDNPEGIKWNRQIENTIIKEYFKGQWERNL